MRSDLPLLLALSANSPFWRGRDSGFASIRTPLFSTFLRVGIPRRFGDYQEYVSVVGSMLDAGAISEPGCSGGTSACAPAWGRSRSASWTRSRALTTLLR